MISQPCEFCAQQLDLESRKFGIKQIFLDQARYLQAQTHHEEQTDERISQTIFGIQSCDAKRRIFPGISVRHRSGFDAPGLEEYCLEGTTNPSLQAIFKHQSNEAKRRFFPDVHARGKPFNHGFRAKGL